LAEDCLQFQENDQDQYIDDLLLINGSSAGAMPKILVSIDSKTSQLKMTDNSLSHHHNDWIVKFKSSLDPKDIGPIEYAYHQMARQAGVIVPEARLFKS
jgi:serine/threonine-protein kinase HipA